MPIKRRPRVNLTHIRHLQYRLLFDLNLRLCEKREKKRKKDINIEIVPNERCNKAYQMYAADRIGFIIYYQVRINKRPLSYNIPIHSGDEFS